MVRASKEVSQNSDDKREVGMESQFLNLNELRNRKPAELMRMARSLNIDEIPMMSKQDLIYAILRAESEKEGIIYAEGVLEILSEGYGFLRSPKYSYLPGPDDIYVSKSQIRSFNLKTGDTGGGQARRARAGEKNVGPLRRAQGKLQ